MVMRYGFAIYGLVFLIVFLETAFLPLFFLPANPLLFISGALCAAHMISLWQLIALLFLAALLGSTLNYWIGRAVGDQIIKRRHRWLDQEAMHKTRQFYEKHGNATFIVFLFIPFVRTFAPFLAGLSALAYQRFQWFSAIGALLWVSVFVAGGYLFGNVPVIRNHLNLFVIMGLAIGLLVPIWRGIGRLRKNR
jgi:membrane-associated protein